MPIIRQTALRGQNVANRGQHLRSLGTTVETLHRSAGTATASPLDPYAVIVGTATGHESCRITPVSIEAIWLDLYHVWRGGTVTSAPEVRVFGRVPREPSDYERDWPQDHDEWPDMTDYDWWIPLQADDTGAALLVLPSEPGMTRAGDEDIGLGLRTRVQLAGCDAVLVTIDTAAVYGGGALGEILGRLVS